MIGTSLGPYKIIEQLGAGGMGEVYLGEDTRLGRKVAIKVLPAEFASDPERLARFEQEARAAAALNHPHIAVVHDIGTEGDTHFMVQEYLEGQSLRERLDKGALPLDKALDLATEVGEALIAAHKAGIIHRDLKPDNIFVTEEGHAKVLDFGLAKLTEMAVPAGSELSMSPTMLGTVAGQVMGTAGYMAPEQINGEEVDHRADLFAFGCVLYGMVTGRQAFGGKNVHETLSHILSDEPTPITEIDKSVPPELQRIVRKLLAKEAGCRYQTAGDLNVDLSQLKADIAAGVAVSAGDGRASDATSTAEAVPGISWKLSGSMAVTALVAGVLGTWWATHPAPPEPEPSLHVEAKLDGVGPDQTASYLALSPDGTRIVYATAEPSFLSEGLYVRLLDELQGNRLVTGHAYAPFFSPDGQWVGFFAETGMFKVRVVDAAAQPVTTAPIQGMGGSWGPDDTIIFGSWGSGLFLVAASGGEPEPLTEIEEGEATHRWPQVLPGGRSVLFTSYTSYSAGSGTGRIEVLDLVTRKRKVVQEGSSFARYVPTGHLVYVVEGTLFAVPFDLEALTIEGSAGLVLPGVRSDLWGYGSTEFSVSRTGTLVYVAGGVADRSKYPVVWVDRQGNPAPLWEEPGEYSTPELSPDDTRLALNVHQDDNMDVWVYDIQRGIPARLTTDEGRDDDHKWSPDGQYLAFNSDRVQPPSVFRVRADGSGNVDRLTSGDYPSWPTSWSADGRFLAYVESHPQTAGDIWVLPMEGDRQPEVFLRTADHEAQAAFSPDGRWIAYISDESGNFEVYVRPYPIATGEWKVSNGGGSQPSWSADGRELFYRTASSVMVVAVKPEADTFDYTSAEELFTGPFQGGPRGMTNAGEFYQDYDVTADGQRFVMFPNVTDDRQDGGDHVTLFLNWFEELKRLVPIDGSQ